MKTMKKMMALVLSVVLMMAMGTTAVFAEESTKNDSITINNAVPGESYSIYKLFDLEVDSETNPTAYSYKVNSAWANFFAPSGGGYQYITINDAGYVTEIKNDSVAALAKAAANWTSKPSASSTIKAPAAAEGQTKSSVTFSNLADGYYLITSTLGTVAMTETTPDSTVVTINEKNPEDTISKEVKEDNTGYYGESNDAQIGQLVEFKSTATIYAHSRNVKIHDTMDSGLTFSGNNSIKIYTDDGLQTELAIANYTIQDTPDTGETFTIQIADNYVDNLSNTQTLYITYTATLNEGAVVKDSEGNVNIVPQKNKTNISYGNEQSVSDETETTTHKFEVLKYDGSDTSKKNLAGATFKLQIPVTTTDNGEESTSYTDVKLIKLDDNNYRVAKDDETGAVDTFTTVADRNIVIWGVDSDSYVLEEMQQPAGYNKLTGKVNVTVNTADSFVSEVENNKGTELPSTGGIGTTIFYVLGAILVIGAAIVLIARRRMDADA